MAQPTVTVITSSIGRPELAQAVRSVLAQDYPCRHHVYINGPRWQSDHTLEMIAGLKDNTTHRNHFFLLPEETGDCGIGPGAGSVFASAPFLTNSDICFFLNDDDFWDPDHVSSLVALMTKHSLAWAYSLRRFVDLAGQPMVDDNWDSLGHHLADPGNEHIVDNSCYAIRTEVARKVGPHWLTPHCGDRVIFRALEAAKLPCGTTGRSTANYRIGLGFLKGSKEQFLANDRHMRARFPRGFPWRREALWHTDAPQQDSPLLPSAP